MKTFVDVSYVKNVLINGSQPELLNLQHEDPNFIKPILDFLLSESSIIRNRCMNELNSIAEKQPELFEKHNKDILHLMEVVKDTDSERFLAGLAGLIQWKDEFALNIASKLAKLLDSTSEVFVKLNCLQSLYNIQLSHPALEEYALDAMGKQTSSKTMAVRSKAKRLMKYIQLSK